jgi:hypothetical protein
VEITEQYTSIAVLLNGPSSQGARYQSVFVSYAHEDEAIVKKLEAAAKAFGLIYLRDSSVSKAGEEWMSALIGHIIVALNSPKHPVIQGRAIRMSAIGAAPLHRTVNSCEYHRPNIDRQIARIK